MVLQEIPIEEKLSQRRVVETLDSVVSSLRILKPNGADVHNRNAILYGLNGHKHLAEIKCPNDVLFEEYRQISPGNYRSIIVTLIKAKNYVPI